MAERLKAPPEPTATIYPISTEAATTAFRMVSEHFRDIRKEMRDSPPDTSLREVSMLFGVDPKPIHKALTRMQDIRELNGMNPRQYLLYRAGSMMMRHALAIEGEMLGERLPKPTNEAAVGFARSFVDPEDGFLSDDYADSFANFVAGKKSADITAKTFQNDETKDRLALVDKKNMNVFDREQKAMTSFINSVGRSLRNVARSEEAHHAAGAFKLGAIDTYALYEAAIRRKQSEAILKPLRKDFIATAVSPKKAEAMNRRLIRNFSKILDSSPEDTFTNIEDPFQEVLFVDIKNPEGMEKEVNLITSITGRNTLKQAGIESPMILITGRNLGEVFHHEDTPFGPLDNLFFDADGRICELFITYAIDGYGKAKKITIVRPLSDESDYRQEDDAVEEHVLYTIDQKGHVDQQREKKKPEPMTAEDLLILGDYDPSLIYELNLSKQAFPDRITTAIDDLTSTDYVELFNLKELLKNGHYVPKHNFDVEMTGGST